MIKYNLNTINEMDYNESPVKEIYYNSSVAYIRKTRTNSYRWVVDGWMCDDVDKYQKLVEQVSYDGGESWQNVVPEVSMQGELIEHNSIDCGYDPGDLFFYSVMSGGTNVIEPCGSVTKIADIQFNGNTYLTSVQLGSCCTEIGNYSFQNCTYVTSFTLSNTITKIGHEALQDMRNTGLTSITIPSGVTEIGFWAFTRMSGVTEFIFESETVFTPGQYGLPMTAVFHDWYPPVVYVPDSAVSDYRAKGVNWWVDGNAGRPSNINTWILPISDRPT